MLEFTQVIDNNFIVIWLRESTSIFAYPTLVAFHSFGLVLLVGITAGISLRTFGFASDLPLAPLDTFFRFVWVGFWICAITGFLLMILDLVTFLTMPAFYIKLLAIVAAAANTRLLRNQLFNERVVSNTDSLPRAKILAALALTFWAVAITAGRVTAYIGWIQRQSALAVFIFAVLMLAGGYLAVHFWNSGRSVSKLS